MYHKSGIRSCGDDAASSATIGEPHPLQREECPVRRPEPHDVHTGVDAGLEMISYYETSVSVRSAVLAN